MSAKADTAAWRTMPLSTLCEETRTTNPSTRPDTLFKYIDVSSVSNEAYQIVGVKSVLGKDAPSRARKVVRRDDVIIATVRPTLTRVAIVPAELDGEVCSTGFCVLRASNEELNPQFLYFYLLTDAVRDRVEALQTGATYPAINDDDLFRLEICLPSLSEQRAIAQALTAVQRAMEARQRELALERERKAALMEHVFTYGIGGSGRLVQPRGYGRAPADWTVLPLEECAFIQTGVAKGRKLGDDETISVPYLRVANVQDGYLNLSEMKAIQIRQSELERYQLQQGDIVLTEGGDFDKLGRGFLWKGEVTPCVHQNHVFAVRPNRSLLMPEFLAYLVQSPYGRSYFLSVAHKTTNLACINKTKLGRFPTLLPRLDEQVNIVKALSASDAKILALEHESRCLRELFKGLLEQLMSGQLDATRLISIEAHA